MNAVLPKSEMMERVTSWLLRRSRYRRLFQKNELGRLVFADLCRRYHFLSACTVQGDQISTVFRDGQRSVIAEIARLSNMSEAEVAKMASTGIPYQQEVSDE